MNDELISYINRCNPHIKGFCLDHLRDFENKKRTHPSKQKLEGGLRLHTLQVIKKALELNQVENEVEIIECCLVHDITGCESLELTECQRMAIAATKGLPYEKWRPTVCYKFVVLILIADMWSAFINERDL